MCLCVCPSVYRLSQKVLDRFWWNLAGWFIMIKDKFLSKMSLIGPLRRKLGTIWIFGEDNMWLTKYRHFLNRHLSMIKRQSVYVGPLHSKPTSNHRGLCWQTKDNNQGWYSRSKFVICLLVDTIALDIGKQMHCWMPPFCLNSSILTLVCVPMSSANGPTD